MFIFGYIIHLFLGAMSFAIVSGIGLVDIGMNQLIFCMLGSLIPDIDHHKSYLGKYNPFAYFMKHRGFTHTVTGCILLSVIGISYHCYFAMLAGCLSHIAGDYISTGGNWKIKII